MKSTILSLLCLFTTITLSAQNVELIDGLKIRLPEDYEIVENKNFDLAAVKGSEAILVKMVESDEIDLDKFKTRADRTFFNLQEFQLTDSKSDKFHMLTKDYHKQYYRNANGAEVMTYASHTNDYAYIILASYSNQEHLLQIENMLDDIEVVYDKWTTRFTYIFSTGKGLILTIFLILSLVIAIIAQSNAFLAFIIGTITWCLTFVCCWGDWPVYLTYVGIGAAFSLMACVCKPGELLQNMIDGI